MVAIALGGRVFDTAGVIVARSREPVDVAFDGLLVLLKGEVHGVVTLAPEDLLS